MGLRRIAACDQRRRRVLIEESLNVVGTEGESFADRQLNAKAGTIDGCSYTAGAAFSAQSPCVAVLASRPFTQVITALSCLVTIVGLLAVYAHWRLWPSGSWPSSLACLDVRRPGSLATWICSLMLCTAAFQGFQIYRLRRHKTDDYRGRYRVWTWFPGVLFAMATGVATGVHRELTALLVASLGLDAAGASLSMLPIAAVGLWLLVAVRLMLEMRANRWSLRFLAAATVAYLAGVIAAQLEVQPISQMLVDLTSSSLIMAGHLGVFVAVMSFGRHVYLDSQGLLPVRAAQSQRPRLRVRRAAEERKRTRRKAAADPAPETPTVQFEPARAEPEVEITPPVLRLGDATCEVPERGSDDEDEDLAEGASSDRLSKTERRRLKKMRRQEQLRRAA
ncbi:MAG: hypothetical protein GX575_07920 [Candidatus Anammoximicrobium sp.]|nr:hypothetical protein [Candidatus Anammoximicrobium sp.]